MCNEAPIQKKIRMQNDVVQILQSHGITPPASSEILITERSVGEPTWSHMMSDQILDATFPKTEATDALHFTLPHALRSILEHGQLWLAPVARNISEGEYKEFAKEHGFSSAQMEKIRRELAECYYYTSFSPVGTFAEPKHWKEFAAGGLGYCLRFHLEPKDADLRRIQYADGQTRLYSRINEDVRQRLGRTLVPWGIARLSAFYLNKKYQDEDEIRLLVPNPSDVFQEGNQKYFAIGLDADNQWCRLTLEEIICGQKNDLPSVEDMLRKNSFDGVKVSARQP